MVHSCGTLHKHHIRVAKAIHRVHFLHFYVYIFNASPADSYLICGCLLQFSWRQNFSNARKCRLIKLLRVHNKPYFPSASCHHNIKGWNPGHPTSKMDSFNTIKVQWNFLQQTAVAESDGLPPFWELTPPPSSACTGGLVAPKLMFKCPTLCCVYLFLAGCGMECDTSG